MNYTGKNRSRTDFDIQYDVDLKPFNTLNVSAVAEQFVIVSSLSQIKGLYEGGYFDNGHWILGGGSNVLFVGRVKELVVKIEIEHRTLVREEESQVSIRAGAGHDWHQLVEWCVNNRWGGLENLALIPGCVGAAPIQNIGAYGVELKDHFECLEAFDTETGEVVKFDKEECRFGYRDSFFKSENPGRYIITSVSLMLDKPPHKIRNNYPSLKSWLERHGIEEPGISDIYEGVIEIRSSKLPDPKSLGNAGSFFKNPIINRRELKELQQNWPNAPCYPVGEEYVKVPAGWLIEMSGWKGKRIGNVGVFENQALVIVNHGDATGLEVLRLAEKIRQSVQEMFGIELVPEVNIAGEGRIL